MTYAQSEACLDALRWQNPTMFLMAISHLMDVGIRHLTPEAIEEICNEIMQQDDAGYIMTNDFQCELVRMAGKIAKIDELEDDVIPYAGEWSRGKRTMLLSWRMMNTPSVISHQ